MPVLLLGAGASVTSGIPAAAATAEKAARWAWCREQGRSPDDIRVTRSDYWPWLCGQSWFREDLSLADQYPKVVENLLGVRKQRRDFFERLIAPGIPPKDGYRSLARVLHEGWITTVLTTNFDHCLDDARILENKPHMLVSIKTTDDLIRFNTSPAEPQLLYLHGSVEHYSDKNPDGEVDALEPGLIERVVPLLRDHPIIVVGYRGTERSVMEGLFLNQMAATVATWRGPDLHRRIPRIRPKFLQPCASRALRNPLLSVQHPEAYRTYPSGGSHETWRSRKKLAKRARHNTAKSKPVFIHDDYDIPETLWEPSQAYLDAVRPEHVKKAIAEALEQRGKRFQK